MNTTIIVTRRDNDIEIEHDGKTSGVLTFGECLELMTALLLQVPGMNAPTWLKTPEEWEAWKARIATKGGAS